MFFAINDDSIEEINEGYYNFIQPKIFNINLENKNKLFLYFYNSLKILITYSNKKLTLNNIDTFKLNENKDMFITLTESEINKYGIIMAIPLINEYPLQLTITNQLFTDINKDIFSLKAGNNAIIYYNNNLVKNVVNTINMQTKQSNDQIEERKLRNIKEVEKETTTFPECFNNCYITNKEYEINKWLYI